MKKDTINSKQAKNSYKDLREDLELSITELVNQLGETEIIFFPDEEFTLDLVSSEMAFALVVEDGEISVRTRSVKDFEEFDYPLIDGNQFTVPELTEILSYLELRVKAKFGSDKVLH